MVSRRKPGVGAGRRPDPRDPRDTQWPPLDVRDLGADVGTEPDRVQLVSVREALGRAGIAPDAQRPRRRGPQETQLTVRDLLEILRRLPLDTPVYRSDSQYQAVPLRSGVERVEEHRHPFTDTRMPAGVKIT